MLLIVPIVILHNSWKDIPKTTYGWPAAANILSYLDKFLSIKVDLGEFSWPIGATPPMLNPVNFLHSSALAFIVLELKIFDTFFKETNLSPETKHKWKFFSVSLKRRLFTIEPTSVLSDLDASPAVLAVSSSWIKFILLLNFFKKKSTFLTVFFEVNYSLNTIKIFHR